MKKLIVLCIVFSILSLSLAVPVSAEGTSIDCGDGIEFSNGVQVVVVQMRTGFTYTATAIGIDGFDPVIAVLGESGEGFCSDDAAEAAEYGADLPTSGETELSNYNAQVEFSNNGNDEFQDITLVVGSPYNEEGEFILVIEGMALTSADNVGDIFALQITEDMVNSGVPMSAYMISVTDGLDSFIYLTNEDLEVLEDGDGSSIVCDDGGNEDTCWGESDSLSGSYVSRSDDRILGGGNLDAMLSVPLDSFEELDFDEGPYFLYFVMSSFEGNSTGDYVVVFHLGIEG